MTVSSTDELLSTAEAARLVRRAQDTIRAAIVRGRLPAVKNHADSTWRVRLDDLFMWDSQATRCTVTRPHPWESVAELLGTFGSASSAELAAVLSIHSGNVRKYLAILATQGRACRHPDGQWTLVDTSELSQEVTTRAS